MTTTENLRGVSGIYCAIHRESRECYVGSSVDMAVRRVSHIRASNTSTRPSAFCRAVRKFGVDSFDFEVLERCEPSLLKSREDFWIAFMGSASVNGFNTCKTSAWHGLSDITKARIGASNKRKNVGKIRTPEQRLRIGEAVRAVWKSRPFPKMTEERRLKHVETLKARKGTFRAETLEKMRLANIGRKLTPEQRAKISKANKGRKFSAEARANMSKAQKGRVVTLEAREKQRIAMTGRTHSPETRAKIREGSFRRWSKRNEDFKTSAQSLGEKTPLEQAAA